MTLGSSDWLSLILMALTMADPCVKRMGESQYINIQDFTLGKELGNGRSISDTGPNNIDGSLELTTAANVKILLRSL